MPHHTKIYRIPRHGTGGLNLPADRETRRPLPAAKGYVHEKPV